MIREFGSAGFGKFVEAQKIRKCHGNVRRKQQLTIPNQLCHRNRPIQAWVRGFILVGGKMARHSE
jgi:hypothetical protein